jgi:hypothetical protein
MEPAKGNSSVLNVKPGLLREAEPDCFTLLGDRLTLRNSREDSLRKAKQIIQIDFPEFLNPV